MLCSLQQAVLAEFLATSALLVFGVGTVVFSCRAAHVGNGVVSGGEAGIKC